MTDKEFLSKLKIVFGKLSEDLTQNFFRIVGKEFGYFDLPKKVGLSDVVNKKIFYRGVREKVYLKELLVSKYNDDFFIGSGWIGDGFYSSAKRGRSSMYSSDESNILRFYLRNCKFIESEELNQIGRYFSINSSSTNVSNEVRENFNERLNEHKNLKILMDFLEKEKYKNKFMNALSNDHSALAVLLGYDVIVSKLFNYCSDDYLILNRSKIVATDKEFRRIAGKDSERVKKSKNLSGLIEMQKGE